MAGRIYGTGTPNIDDVIRGHKHDASFLGRESTMTTNNRIAHIQAYANERGFVLALAPMSKGLHTIGFLKAGEYTQRLILDQAIETINEYAGMPAFGTEPQIQNQSNTERMSLMG